MQAILYFFSFDHHGSHSAFNHLAAYLPEAISIDITLHLPGWLPDRLKWQVVAYWRKYREQRLWAFCRKQQSSVIHYLYPENTLFQGWKWKREHRLVLTCHQPESTLLEMKQQGERFAGFFEGLAAADAVVVLSETQVSLYRQLAPQAQVVFIPYGVDTEFFAPSRGVSQEKEKRVLTVGNWLRDYQQWGEVVRRIVHLRRDVMFDVIANGSTLHDLKSYASEFPDQVNLMTGLSDDELLERFQTASILFLPLKDAIANTALLEGMACGLPTVVTDLPAIREYGRATAIYVEKNNVAQCATAILRILDNPDLRTTMAAASRQTALRFDWHTIASRYRELYRSLC